MITYKDIDCFLVKIYDQSGRANHISLPSWPMQQGSDGSIRILTPKRTAEFYEYVTIPRICSDEEIEIRCRDITSAFISNRKILKSKQINLINSNSITINRRPNDSIIKMLKSEHADLMLDEGRIRLGSIEKFREYDHPEIGDASEGQCILVYKGLRTTSFFAFRGGLHEWIFCCHYGDPKKEISRNFNYDAKIEITDVDGFSNAIATHLGTSGAKYARCQYSDTRILIENSIVDVLPENIFSNFEENIGVARAFIKPSKFRHQNEFRFLWPTPTGVQGSLDICCPEIKDFCKRIKY